MTLAAKFALALAIAISGFFAGWAANGWRLSGNLQALKTAHAEAIAKAEGETVKAQAIADTKAAALTQALSKIDARESTTITESKNETQTVRANVASGVQRLYVHAACPPSTPNLPRAPAGSSVDTGAAPGLTADAEQAYFSLRDGLAQQRGQLAACQQALKAERNAP